MARAIWTGSITFGLVSIPVGLFSATEDHTVHFHQFQRDTSDRIRNQRVNERTGKEVEYADIVKGADVGDGEHVIVEPDELDSIAPGRSRTVEITDFVDLDEIDPLYFNRTYWLAPTGDQHTHPYRLLLEAMTRTNRAAIGTFVMRGKEYLAAIRPDGDVLALETMFFADEVRDPAKELDNIPESGAAKGRELDMATQLIESMSGPWRPDSYRDSYQDRVRKLIEDKRRGREIVTESAGPEPTEVSDLLAALERSVSEARGRGGAGERGGGGGRTGSSSGRTDLAEATKTELLEVARELDIPGRSRMKREQLVEAVADARRKAKRAS
ncbi:MAG: end-binding protein Ku [Pseudonocardiales bacterium]|nr:end-binding protein Ku [Pseudonocardiales bacterium]